MIKPRIVTALCTAGAISLAASSAGAAPVGTNAAALKSAVPGTVTDVRWHGGWGWGGAWLPGAIFGGLAFGALAATSPYWYGAPYGYGYYGYGPYAYGYAPFGYAYAPYYGGWGYGWHRGWHHGWRHRW